MAARGPDACKRARHATLAPHKLDNSLAFVFESRWRFRPAAFALANPALDRARRADCRTGLADRFAPP